MTKFIQTTRFRSREQRSHCGPGQGPDHTWLWWACSLQHTTQRSLQPSHRAPGLHFLAPGCLWTVRIVFAVGLEVATIVSLGMAPTSPAVNMAGDPALGWGLALVSGAQSPEKGSLEGGRTLHSIFLAGLCEAHSCARRLWPHPVGFLLSIAVHGSLRRQLWSWAEALSYA